MVICLLAGALSAATEIPFAARDKSPLRLNYGTRPWPSTGTFFPTARGQTKSESVYDVKAFGATGDGITIDSPAINRAIETAASAGGGTVKVPAGTYLCFSIRLRSKIAIQLEAGATIRAADPATVKGTYDLPEPNEWDMYQDFGHSHWQNSLFWGIGIDGISIMGPGMIDGGGLTRRSPRPRRPIQQGDRPVTLGGTTANPPQSPLGEDSSPSEMNGLGNKAISLKLCRDVTIRDISIRNGGHFAILATGVDNFTIDNVKIDTNRDGIDIDACRNVRVSNCSVNSPNDDAIVLKSSFALGYARATENVTITNCLVSGYELGSLLDGTFKHNANPAPDRDGPTGRIKLGTESNGGFRNITISNVVFANCRGLAFETVDGGPLEDIVISNITMRDIVNSPIFLRLGKRLRAPTGTQVGTLRRVNISNIVVYNAESRYASIISGLAGHDIEDVRLSNLRIVYRGGAPKELANVEPEERETNYPEPSMFGDIPAYGLFIRHARGVNIENVEFTYLNEDLRPAFALDDVKQATFSHVTAQHAPNVPQFSLMNVTELSVHHCKGLADMELDKVERKRF